ncbi:MAG: ABC transporter substrate-binding protein [Anaerolineales bacterium]
MRNNCWRVFSALILTGCVSSTRPVVKIALVAPFEGRYRELGYEVITAARLAVREANASAPPSSPMITLVAFDDQGDPVRATEQARKVSADDEIVAVVGHWLEETSAAAVPVYTARQLPVIVTASAVPDHPGVFHAYPSSAALDDVTHTLGPTVSYCACGVELSSTESTAAATGDLLGPSVWALDQFWRLNEIEGARFVAPVSFPQDITAAAAFRHEFTAASAAGAPGPHATLAYDIVNMLAAAIRSASAGRGAPPRAKVAVTLANFSWEGLAGAYAFDENGRLSAQLAHVYEWRSGTVLEVPLASR